MSISMSLTLKGTITALIIVALALCTLMYASCACPSPAPTPTPPPPTPTPTPVPETKIIWPSDGDTVPREIIVKGIVPELPLGATIWVCVFVGDRYYPQQPSAVFQVEGEQWLRWQTPVWVGQPYETGMSFNLFAILADENASRLLENYMEQSRITHSWVGITELPKGTTVYDQIGVYRR